LVRFWKMNLKSDSSDFHKKHPIIFSLVQFFILFDQFAVLIWICLDMNTPSQNSKPRKSRFNHIFYNSWYPNYLSNGISIIHNSTSFSISTHPMQHSQLCYTKLILVLAFYCSPLSLTQHRRSYSCNIKFYLNAFLNFNHPTWIR
jgi:hypothetical protein